MNDKLHRKEEKALVARIRGGDRESFEGFVRTNQEYVRRFCTALLRDPALGDDAAQETFLKAYRSIGGFKGDCRLVTWLLRIARNQCVDLLRAQRRDRWVSS